MFETTWYFDNKVVPKRRYATLEICSKVVNDHDGMEIQPDGRYRYWRKMEELGGRYLRVVLLPDNKTIHNAFLDRGKARKNR